MRIRVYRFWIASGILLAGVLVVGPRAAAPQRPFDSAEHFEQARRLREEAIRQEQQVQAGLARARRREALARLQDDLAQVHKDLQALEEKLRAVDTDREVSVELRQQG